MQHLLTARTLRFGLAAFASAGATSAALLAGCGHDDSSDGTASDSGLVDTHVVDVTTDVADAGSTPTPRITLVNAIHDLGPNANKTNHLVRLCFAQGPTSEKLSVLPLPAVPAPIGQSSGPQVGVHAGAGAQISTLGVDFSRRIVMPFVVNALRIFEKLGEDGTSSEPTCDALIGDAAVPSLRLTFGIDYWALPAIQPGTLVEDHAYVVVLFGCVANADTPNPGKCGVGFARGDDPGVGNLSLTAYEPTATPIASPFGAQLLYASTQANAYFSQAGMKASIRPGFYAGPADGGTVQPITLATPRLGTLSTVTAVADLPGRDGFAFGPGPLLPSTLAEIRERSELTPSQPPYPGNRNYVFIALGDPDPVETFPWILPNGSRGQVGGADGSRFNLRSFHFLAYPADGR